MTFTACLALPFAINHLGVSGKKNNSITMKTDTALYSIMNTLHDDVKYAKMARLAKPIPSGSKAVQDTTSINLVPMISVV